MKKLISVICIASMLCAMVFPVGANTADTGERDADIFDALEILKELVGITPNGAFVLTGKEDLSIFDALEILKGLVGMTETVKVYVKLPCQTEEPPSTAPEPTGTTYEPASLPPITTAPDKPEEPKQDGEIDYNVVDCNMLAYDSSLWFNYTDTPTYAATSLDELNFIINKDKMTSTLMPDTKLPLIDENFFKDKAIIVTYKVLDGSTKRLTLKSLKTKQDTLTTTFEECSRRGMQTADMVVYRFILAVDKSDLSGISEFNHSMAYRNHSPSDCKCDACSGNLAWACQVGEAGMNNWFNYWIESKKYLPEIDYQIVDCKMLSYNSRRQWFHFTHRPTYVVTSYEELKSVIAEEEDGLPVPWVDEDFFNDKALVVAYNYLDGSTNRLVLNSLRREQDTLLTNYVYGTRDGMHTCDMVVFRFILAVDRAAVIGVNEFKYFQGYRNFSPDNCQCSGCIPYEQYCQIGETALNTWYNNWLTSKKYVPTTNPPVSTATTEPYDPQRPITTWTTDVIGDFRTTTTTPLYPDNPPITTAPYDPDNPPRTTTWTMDDIYVPTRTTTPPDPNQPIEINYQSRFSSIGGWQQDLTPKAYLVKSKQELKQVELEIGNKGYISGFVENSPYFDFENYALIVVRGDIMGSCIVRFTTLIRDRDKLTFGLKLAHYPDEPDQNDTWVQVFSVSKRDIVGVNSVELDIELQDWLKNPIIYPETSYKPYEPPITAVTTTPLYPDNPPITTAPYDPDNPPRTTTWTMVDIYVPTITTTQKAGIEPLSEELELRIKNDLLNFRKIENKNFIFSKYLGIYNGSVAVFLQLGRFAAVEFETVAGYTFLYPNMGDCIYIWNNGEFYRLQQAYDDGLLTEHDIGVIKDRYSTRPIE